MSFWRALLREAGLTRSAKVESTEAAMPASDDQFEEPAAVPQQVPASAGRVAGQRPLPQRTAVSGTVAKAPTAGTRAASLERTLQSLVERLGTEHPDTITARNNLATKYAQMGRRQAAVQQFELALGEAVAVYGEEHPRTEIIRENLAWALEDVGCPADAAAQWEILLGQRESQFGPADEDTVEARMRLAVCYRRSGRVDAAVAHYARAIEDVASTERREELRLGMSAAQSMAGRYEEAVSQLRMVLAGRRRRLGKGHLDTLAVHHRLGRAYTQAGRADEAVEVLREAYRVALNSSGDPEVRRLTMRLRRDLAGAYNAAGRHREANALL
ncbi:MULTISPECIES: tetratricopeptide repeat protein [unclassified Nocardiopsis]|uniref:tetratricopeptide repeat protein n=1 Tax=unclassified Nocardiopsis TaxID=2649073 RepID=UPI00066CD00A|nr:MULTISPECIES: tetratricopeptide repeat protein [unclassified Nocardiopsis]MBQ1081514.1 tetratricopeptide repeat protein [Nocardiopsis sp. B62]